MTCTKWIRLFSLKIYRMMQRGNKTVKTVRTVEKERERHANTSACNPDKDFPIILCSYRVTQCWSCICLKTALPSAYELCNHVTSWATQTWPLKLPAASKYTTISFYNRHGRASEGERGSVGVSDDSISPSRAIGSLVPLTTFSKKRWSGVIVIAFMFHIRKIFSVIQVQLRTRYYFCCLLNVKPCPGPLDDDKATELNKRENRRGFCRSWERKWKRIHLPFFCVCYCLLQHHRWSD